MKPYTSVAIMAISVFIPCALLFAQNPSTPTETPIQVPKRIRPAIEAAFKDGRNYFIWLVEDTKTVKATRAGMPFPHALIECYGVANPKQPNPTFKTTIEMVAAESTKDSTETKVLYADANLVKDSAWWSDAQAGKPFSIVFAYIPQDRKLTGSSQVKLYLTDGADKTSHVPRSNVVSIRIEIPD